MIWVMAFQNFAQKHSESDMLLLTLYRLTDSCGSACAAVSCICVCEWPFPRWPFGVIRSCVFHLLGEKNIFNFYLMCKIFLIDCLSFFLPPFFFLIGVGGLFFVCFVCVLQCCLSQSMLGAKCSLRVMFCGHLLLQ